MIKISGSQLLEYPTGQILSDNAISKISSNLYDYFSSSGDFRAETPFIKYPSTVYDVLESRTIDGELIYNNLWQVGFDKEVSATVRSVDGLIFDILRGESLQGYNYEFGFYGKNSDTNEDVNFIPFRSFRNSSVTDTNGNTHQIYVNVIRNDDASITVTTNIVPISAYISHNLTGEYTFVPNGIAMRITSVYLDSRRTVVKIDDAGSCELGTGNNVLNIDDKYFSNVKLEVTDTNENYIEYLANRILSSWSDGRRTVEFNCVFDDYVDTDGVVVYRKKNGEFFVQGDKIVLDVTSNTARDLSFANTPYEVVESTLNNDNGHVYVHVVAIEYIPFINLRANGINYGTYREIIVSSDYENAVFDCESDGISWTVENGGRLIALQLQSMNKVINVQAHTSFGKIYNYQVIINTDTPLYVYTDYSGNQHDILWTQINSGGGNGGSGTIAT